MAEEQGRRRPGWAALAGVVTIGGTVTLGFGTAFLTCGWGQDTGNPSTILLTLATIALAVLGLRATAALGEGRKAMGLQTAAVVVLGTVLLAAAAGAIYSVVRDAPTGTPASQDPARQRANWPDDLLVAAERAEGIMNLTLARLTAIRSQLNVDGNYNEWPRIPSFQESVLPESHGGWCDGGKSELLSAQPDITVDYDMWDFPPDHSPPVALPMALAVIRDTWIDMGLDVQEDWPLPDVYPPQGRTILSAVLDDGTELAALARVGAAPLSGTDTDYLWVFVRYRTACYPAPASPTSTAG